jgi:hypothetical protein
MQWKKKKKKRSRAMQPSLSVRGFDRVVNSVVWNHLPRGNWTGINPGTGKQPHAATSSRAYKEGSLPVRTQQATPPAHTEKQQDRGLDTLLQLRSRSHHDQ